LKVGGINFLLLNIYIYMGILRQSIKKILLESFWLKQNPHLLEVVPKKYIYHTSNPIFRDKISKEGLTPRGKSESWLSDTKIDGKVIFAINSNKKEDIWDSGYDDDLYRINTTNLKNKWYHDPNFVS
jgi:hypothetical protein